MSKNRSRIDPSADATGVNNAATPDIHPVDSRGRMTLAIESFADRFARFVVAERIWLIVASAVIVPVLGLSLFHAEPAADARVFFGKDNPELIALKELDATYSETDGVIFVVRDKSGSLFTPEGLKALAQMTEDAWQVPYVLRVNSVANFQEVYTEGDEIRVAPLYSPDETLDPPRVAEIKRETLGQQEIVNKLISLDGSVAGIAVRAVLPENDRHAIPTVTEYSRNLAKQWESRWPFVEVNLTGGIIADMAFSEAAKRDQSTLVPLMGFLIFGALALGLRSFRATLVVFAVIVSSMIAGIGTAVWLGSQINAATASSPIAIMVLALASAVHLLSAWIRAGSAGLDSKGAVYESVKLNFAPVALTTVTTMLGFLSLNFSDAPPLRSLGNIVAIGAGFSWIFCLTLLPALISYVRPVRPVVLDSADRILARIGMLSTERPVTIAIVFSCFSAVMAYGASLIVLDDNYIRYFDETYEFRRGTDYTEKYLHGLNVIEYSLDSGSPGGIFEPDFLDKIDEFSDWFKQKPEVITVSAIPPLLKRLNRAVHNNEEEEYRIADSREANAQNFLLYELSLPVGQDSTDFIDIDRAKTIVTVFVSGGSSLVIKELASAGEDWLGDNAPDISVLASGLSVAFAYVSERNLKAMISGTTFALVFVSLILVFAFQSLRIGLLTLVPNLLPGLLAFGAWGFLVGEVNLAATVVTSMTFGIIVDDTIHITMKYLRGRRVLGKPPDAAARYALSIVGFPVFVTTVAIASGFAVIALSGFQLSRFLGGLTVLVVCIALVADLLFLPALLMITERFKQR